MFLLFYCTGFGPYAPPLIGSSTPCCQVHYNNYRFTVSLVLLLYYKITVYSKWEFPTKQFICSNLYYYNVFF